MSRVLVLGAGGMLGHKICQHLSQRGHDLVGAARSASPGLRHVLGAVDLVTGVDVLGDEALEAIVARSEPEWIINAVGVVKQHAAAHDRFVSIATNSLLPHRLARLCHRTGARLIHFSTDCVFSGRKGGYEEGDPSDAEDIYGKSKYLGETDETEDNAVTLRTSMIGRELRHPTHGLVEWFLAQRGRAVNGFTRAIFSGPTTLELAKVSDLIIRRHEPISGVFHVAAEPIAKYDLLRLLEDAFEADVRIEREDQIAIDRSLLGRRFARVTGYQAPSWPAMVREMAADPTPYEALQSGDFVA